MPLDEETLDICDKFKGRNLTVTQDGKFIILGCREGSIRILFYKSGKMHRVIRDSKEEISDITISPNGYDIA